MTSLDIVTRCPDVPAKEDIPALCLDVSYTAQTSSSADDKALKVVQRRRTPFRSALSLVEAPLPGKLPWERAMTAVVAILHPGYVVHCRKAAIRRTRFACPQAPKAQAKARRSSRSRHAAGPRTRGRGDLEQRPRVVAPPLWSGGSNGSAPV
jgi:hypothetical protein